MLLLLRRRHLYPSNFVYAFTVYTLSSSSIPLWFFDFLASPHFNCCKHSSVVLHCVADFFYYRSTCIIDNGAHRRRTRNARFRARRADHSTKFRFHTELQISHSFKSFIICCQVLKFICGSACPLQEKCLLTPSKVVDLKRTNLNLKTIFCQTLKQKASAINLNALLEDPLYYRFYSWQLLQFLKLFELLAK